MAWVNEYRSKLTTAEKAVKSVKSGDKVFIGGNVAIPTTLVRALAERKDELFDVEIIHLLALGEAPYAEPGMEKHFRHNALFVGPSVRDAVNEGRADYIPIHLHMISKLFYSKQISLDVAMLHVSRPDEHGFVSLGVEVTINKAAAETAKVVIAQISENMPRTLGNAFIHVSKLTHIVEVDDEVPELPSRPFTEVERKIGHVISDLIEDGSTLQLGIGGIPDAVLNALSNKRNLGIHTEMLSDGAIHLMEKGIINNEAKTFHRGKTIVSFIMGSKDLYKFVDNNPMFEFHPTDYVNDPFNIAKNDKMVAINSAIEVDLTGQVCSDSIGCKIYSGFGGQVDFIRGSAHSNGGKPIIALPSTTKNLSRIVSRLKTGAGVVTTRADVHYVVTEYGYAFLFGKNIRQRAKALIDIAHPDFREQLEKEAYETGIIPKMFRGVDFKI